MPLPRPPSRIEPLTFPVFGISWFGNPADGRSLLAYTGGGGSARTGVMNNVVVRDGDEPPTQISTGDQVGVALHIYQTKSRRIWMIVALGGDVHRFAMPDGDLNGVLKVAECDNDTASSSEGNHPNDYCSAVAINGTADKMAVGCDSGVIKVYPTSDDCFADVAPLYFLRGHDKSICALSFSMRNEKLLSSAKDGYARVWDVSGTSEGNCLFELLCSCVEDNAPPPKRSQQILVRGCAFCDMDGNVALTVASARRGKAYLSQWFHKDGKYNCAVRTVCSAVPVSAMSMSQDGRLLALGSVDGSIILWSILDWTALKIFPQIHALPVTCIAARPFDVDLRGEELTGVRIHARSASADSQLACLTLQRRAPRKRKDDSSGSGGSGFFQWIHRLFWTSFMVWVLSPVAREAVEKCEHTWKQQKWDLARKCLMDEVLMAPSTRPGVIAPPY